MINNNSSFLITVSYLDNHEYEYYSLVNGKIIPRADLGGLFEIFLKNLLTRLSQIDFPYA